MVDRLARSVERMTTIPPTDCPNLKWNIRRFGDRWGIQSSVVTKYIHSPAATNMLAVPVWVTDSLTELNVYIVECQTPQDLMCHTESTKSSTCEQTKGSLAPCLVAALSPPPLWEEFRSYWKIELYERPLSGSQGFTVGHSLLIKAVIEGACPRNVYILLSCIEISKFSSDGVDLVWRECISSAHLVQI